MGEGMQVMRGIKSLQFIGGHVVCDFSHFGAFGVVFGLGVWIG